MRLILGIVLFASLSSVGEALGQRQRRGSPFEGVELEAVDLGKEGKGLKVGELEEQNRLAMAGLREGDVLVAIGDQSVATETDIRDAFRKWAFSRSRGSAPPKLHVIRAGERVEVEMGAGRDAGRRPGMRRPGSGRGPGGGAGRPRPGESTHGGEGDGAQVDFSIDDELKIVQLVENGGGARAGLRLGDRVTHYGLEPLNSKQDLSDRLARADPETQEWITVERGGGRLVFTVELQEPEGSESRTEEDSATPRRGGSLATSAPLVGATAPPLDPTTPLDAKRPPKEQHAVRVVVFGSFT